MRDSSGTALAVGRLTGQEPLGFEAGDNNWYRFVANEPTGRTDPTGLHGWIPGPTVGGVTHPWIPPGTYLPGHPHSTPPNQHQKWAVPDFFWWYYFGSGKDVDLHEIGLFEPWWAAIKPQVLAQLKLNVVPGLESQLSCENGGSSRGEILVKPFTIRVTTGGGIADPLTVMGNSIVNVRGTCKITLQCKQCCAGESVMVGSTGSCDLNFTIADKFQNPLDWGGPFGKHDWPGATPYGLVASWGDTYTWNKTHDSSCPEDQKMSK
jgi:hypothetical protein